MNLLLLLALAAYLGCLAGFGYAAARHLCGRTISEEDRIRRYRSSIRWNAGSLAAVLVVTAALPVTTYDLGFRPLSLSENGTHIVFRLAVLLIAGLLTVLFLYQMLSFSLNPAFRREQALALKKRRDRGGWYACVVDNLIPRSHREKRWFTLAALTAGISEEVVFRGFALWLLGTVFPGISAYGLAAAAGILFGLAHFYQGVDGMVKTALLGMLFGFLFLGTDSLLFCIILHTLFDFSSAFLYGPEHQNLEG